MPSSLAATPAAHGDRRIPDGQRDPRLAMDAVQQANSGHPGAPMGMADIAVALWHRHLKHNPANPHWFDRDRFVLSNGHASMLLYALLHLTGYDLPLGELKGFRQLHSKTPATPKWASPRRRDHHRPAGPGLTNAVGMALAEKLLAAEFNRDGHDIVDHHTYVFLGDGCLMEGISHEACALAGAWKLNKLVAIYDDNGISIDGQVTPWFIDDTPRRFQAYGWNVIGPVDGHDIDAVDRAIADARRSADKPTLIVAKTTSARAARTAPTPPRRTARRSAPRKSSSRATRSAGRTSRSWCPRRLRRLGRARPRATKLAAEWDERFAAYAPRTRNWPPNSPPHEGRAAAQLRAGRRRRRRRRPHQGRDRRLAQGVAAGAGSVHRRLPELLGGSADLTGSNLTNTKSTPPLRFDLAGDVKMKTKPTARSAATSTTACASSAWPPS
jgi:transketolase